MDLRRWTLDLDFTCFSSIAGRNQCSDDPFKPEFEERAVMDFEQPVRDVNSVIRVDADQMSIEGGVVDLRQRQAIRDHRLP